jgi:hypothetical protein
MLYLDSEDSSKPIYLYINSPGGSVNHDPPTLGRYKSSSGERYRNRGP